jgi:hypothetical protein
MKQRQSYAPNIVVAWFRECGIPEPVFEYAHIPGRRFRLDIAWPAHRVGLEIQGGLWIKAAHSTATGIKRDMEKRNLGIVAGWKVLECEPRELCTAAMAELIKTVLKGGQK